MERRELIKLVTLATGAVLTVPLSSALLTSCKKVERVKDIHYTLQFFNKEDFALLQNLLELILPKTDSPSAIDVGVHQIMDTMMGTVYSPDQKKRFSEMFSALKEQITPDIKLETLQSLSKSSEEKDNLAKAALLDIQQQAIVYYLSTKEISTNYLNYLPIPGEYESCISLESVGGKSWAI